MISQVGSNPRSLESLPARPPTPPRENKQDVVAENILSNRLNQSVDTLLNLHTPPSHSPNNTNTTNTSSRRLGKRVGFSAEAEYRDAPTSFNKENVRKRATPHSGSSSKPIKSILKRHSSPLSHSSLDLSAAGNSRVGQINIIAMLNTAIRELAGADRDAKIDSYMSLAQALKTSNNLPDRIALQDKMSLFMQFIQRDITAKSSNGDIDSSMVNHALTLLCTFFHFPAIASMVPSNFGVFIIDHSIKSFGDLSVPKDVVRHLMQVVASQNFSTKVMTADRVGRLVTSVHEIENHLKGKSIIMSRILIYRKLIKQSRSHMSTHTDWLLDLFNDMLSSMKEIRSGAIALGLEAGFTIGREPQLARRVMEILHMQVEDTQYQEYYRKRVQAMTKDKSSLAFVPQIWSVVVLLVKCPADKWEHFWSWLELMQHCFNSGDPKAKIEANYAWNRLVYALRFHELQFSRLVTSMSNALTDQLRRKVVSKKWQEVQSTVMAGICNMIYYAFKPNLSIAQVDTYWDTCVQIIFQSLISSTSMEKRKTGPTKVSENLNLKQALPMLSGLFDSSTQRLWKEDRVAENSLIKPDELPAFDPKWVRRNAARVFGIVEPILQETFLDLATSDSPSYKLWRTLVSAVAAAASKEVKVSIDTATFMAHAFSVLARIWSQGLHKADIQPELQHKFLDATHAYVSTMVESLGLLPFTERLLSLHKQNSFIPIATPSHRSGKGKGQGLTRTPLHHLFSILSTIPPGIPDDDGLLNLVRTVFDPFVISRISSHAKMDLAREFLQTLPIDAICPYGPWVFIADILSLSVDNSQSSYLMSTPGSDSATIGHEYRDIVKHLERGLRSTPNLPWENWNTLFQLLVTRVTCEVGETGCAIAVVEPLAKSLMECHSLSRDKTVPYILFKSGIELIITAKQPRDRQALDSARRRLWGTSVAGSKSASSDPFEYLYRLTNHFLENSYTHLELYDQNDIVVPLLKEVGNFLARCNSASVPNLLACLRDGICHWIQDSDIKCDSKQPSEVPNAVSYLWDKICILFLDVSSPSNLQLGAFEDLLCAAFQSKNGYIVIAVSATWNYAFEKFDEIPYPEKLKEVLLSIHPYVDVVLPGLDVANYESSRQEPSFIESQDDSEGPAQNLSGAGQLNTPERLLSSGRSGSPGSVQLSLPTKHRDDTTPNISRPRSAKSNVTPRLRHDNSQIQFAPIESSPSHDAKESQLLTDRQKETRERQRENAALYSDVRVSTEKQKSPQPIYRPASQHSGQAQHPCQPRAITPQLDHVEDYVSSTPTPRRGQAPISYEDQEMTDDIPSSPPKPCRNLLPQMKPGCSQNSSVFEGFPILSSPVSGSPVPKRTISTDEENTKQAVAGDVEDDVADDIEHDVEEDIEDDTMEFANHGKVDESVGSKPELALTPVGNGSPRHVTPRGTASPRITRSSSKAMVSSPRSDSEAYVDAPSSPSQTSRALRSKSKANQAKNSEAPVSQSKDISFELSDGEERSMARLVIPLDSSKCEPLPGYGNKSPKKLKETGGVSLECITVQTVSKRLRSRSKKGESNQTSPVMSPASPEVEASHPSNRRAKRKRKRHAERDQEFVGSSKKQKHGMHAEPEPVTNNTVSGDIDADAMEMEMEMDAAMEDGLELDKEASLSSSPLYFSSSPPDRESDTEAVNLQIITEASQQSGAGASSPTGSQLETVLIGTDTEMEGQGVEEQSAAPIMPQATEIAMQQAPTIKEAVPEKPSADVIMKALMESLQGLRTATLTRDEVNRIEDVFFDIKKELYQAESRSRSRDRFS